MSSQEKREVAVPKYFRKTPDAPKYQDTTFVMIVTIGGLLAGFLGLMDMNDLWGLMCIGVPAVFFAGSAWLTASSANTKKRTDYEKAYKETEPKPSDEQIDQWRQNDLNKIRTESMSKLDLVPEQVMGDANDPIMVVGPSAGALATMGKDNIIRFSRHDVVIVYLTDYHLAAYSCTIDLSDGLQVHESTQEYHYTDVVSVATQTDNSRVFKVVVNGQDKPLANYQKFALSVASGERIEVAISFPQIDDVIKNARLAPTGAENAVKIIRARLREKKGGTQE